MGDGCDACRSTDAYTYFSRVVETFTPAQNSTGGFGGGHGQISHCAPSYAVILSLAQVGAHQALEMVDRRALCVITTFASSLCYLTH